MGRLMDGHDSNQLFLPFLFSGIPKDKLSFTGLKAPSVSIVSDFV